MAGPGDGSRNCVNRLRATEDVINSDYIEMRLGGMVRSSIP